MYIIEVIVELGETTRIKDASAQKANYLNKKNLKVLRMAFYVLKIFLSTT